MEISRWIKPPTPEEIRQIEADRHTARRQMWLERNEDSPDETSRELNDRPEQYVPKAQVIAEEYTPDETPRELENGPEQHMPNAQAVDGKECESLSQEVIVEEEMPTTDPNGNKILMFAPTWLKKDSKFGSQFDVQIRAPDPPNRASGGSN